MRDATVRRAAFGYFVRPGAETGNGVSRVEPCLGYLVHHAEGVLLFDTGMGRNPEVDAPGARYAELDGEAELLPGVFLLPTPGHTEGHQSLVVRRGDGTVVVAGQSHDTATAYSADVLAWRAHRDGLDGPDLPVPAVLETGDAFEGAYAISVRHHAHTAMLLDQGPLAAGSTR
jgi:hypothetical protein